MTAALILASPKEPTCAQRGCDATHRLAEVARLKWCPRHVDAALEGLARMAVARRDSGQPLTHEDHLALEHFPDPPMTGATP